MTTQDRNSKGRKRTMQGIVVSRSGDKTVAVEVLRTTRHPKYGKLLKKSKKYLVHDPNNAAGVGQAVTIAEDRPRSRRKRWILIS